MSANATDPMIGRLIDGRYQVRSRIARGGMATVYLATDLRLERRVAVKVMHGHLADDSQFKQRFIQEARSAARLAHPNVVNVFDQGQDSDSAYLVMEYLPGITLRELLEEYGSLTPQQTIDITEAVLNGLSAAHKAGIIHRDLKPENVLLADDGRIKIGDFGLARATSAQTATGAQLLGTIAYLSPELVTRGVADTRSDIYAVGIMMYEMLTGEQPFTGDQPMQIAYRHANEPVPPPSLRNPKIPRELDELVLWATAKDPDQRPADAKALLDQVRDTESALDLPAAPPNGQRTRLLPSSPPRHPGPFSSGAVGGTGDAPTSAFTAALHDDHPFADAETQVLGRRPAGGPGGALAVSEPIPPRARRRTRRWIPIVAVLAVAALVGGLLGWWFTLGPGGHVTIPKDVAGMSESDARAALTRLGLVVADATGTASSPDIPIGAVAETDPPVGESVAKGSSVTLRLSTGPQLLDITLTAGMSEADATALVESHWTLDATLRQFDGSVASGLLLDALGADGSSLIGVAQYGEKQKITLIVSAGPLPDVAKTTEQQATDILAGVKLTVDDGLRQESFSDDVAEGAVIGIIDPGHPIREGDSVGLIVSKGPEPVDVPAVVGKTWTEAKDAILSAGLQYAFERPIDELLAQSAPDDATVSRITPDEGETVYRGDLVTVRLTSG